MVNQELKVAKKVLEYFSSPESARNSSMNWAFIHKGQSFEDVYKRRGQACFGGLESNFKTGSKYFVFWNFYRRKIYNYSTPLTNYEKNYIRYIVEDSIFSSCFHTKKVKTIFKNGCIMHTNMPAQFVYSAASSIRYVSEVPEIPEMWNYFRKYIGEDESLVLAHLFLPVNEDDKTTHYQSNPYWSSQHKWMVGPHKFGPNEFKIFCDRNLIGLEGLPSFSENCDFTNVVKIWKPNRRLSHKKFVWIGGTECESSRWNSVVPCVRQYSFENLKEDIKAMLEVNRVNT